MNTQNSQSTTEVLVTGFAGIALVLAIAAACIAPFGYVFFLNWVATAFIAATPAQVILGLLWESSKPDAINRLQQPAKGLALTGITIVAGAIVLALIVLLVSGGHGITPMLVQFTIVTVAITLWMVAIWECWPFSILNRDPIVFGILTLVFSYLLAYLLWQIFFDYSALAQIDHPLYYTDVDPGGMFDMWVALTFCVTAAAVIVVHALFDFWPIDKLALGTAQPIRGVIGTIYVLALAWLIRTAFVDGMGMDQVNYMARVPVSMIFGTFLVNNMMQGALFVRLAQPIRGIVLTFVAILAAVLMYNLYDLASSLHAGRVLGTGLESGFERELWIASAMLGITFPVIFIVSGFFAFWPIKR